VPHQGLELERQGKKFKVIQRPELINKKIIETLETKHGFNLESLLKSIKSNKHNHLTATYYLLLKKHMVRHFKPFCEAFMELSQISDPPEIINTKSAVQVMFTAQ
jgi:hypothetical protein